MLEKLTDFIIETLIILFLPLVHMYHAITDDCVLNVAVENRSAIEEVANTCLIPYQFVFAGRKATLTEEGHWNLEPRFAVDEWFWPKMTLSVAALPVSLTAGSLFKGLSYLFSDVREKIHSIRHSTQSITDPRLLYQSLGIALTDSPALFASQNLPRRSGETNHLREEKECLATIASLFNEAKILWWLDCGSCLGAYRYGGIIPWDGDIDIAVLLSDFDNVFSLLRRLDPQKYLVQDWSGREFPKSYLKVFLRKTNSWIDIYHFAIDSQAQEVRYILSLENNIFFPERWKIRERRFTVPTAFQDVFPLKKALFDGIEVFVPANPEKYLQLRYGENLAPAKIYNPLTNEYEKDLTHPYWQRAYVH